VQGRVGLGDVGSPLQQARGESGREHRQRDLLDEPTAPRNVGGVAAQQHRERVLGLGDLTLGVRHGFPRLGDQDLGLPDVDERGDAALLSHRHELQRVGPTRQGVARDLELLVEIA
jgi:hypothetical protein